MKTIFIMAVSMIVAMASVQAQSSFGIRAGTNLATWGYHFEDAEAEQEMRDITSIQPLLQGAIFFRQQFNHLAIQPEFCIVQKGTLLDYSEDDYQYHVIGTLNYAEVPLLLKGVWGTEKQFTVFGGPAFSYGISGVAKSVQISNGEKTRDKQKINWEDEGFNRFEVGVQAGIGGSFKAGRGAVELEARYEYGITNLASDETSRDKIANRGLAISVGYTLPLVNKK